MATKIRLESVQPAGAGDLVWHPDGTRVVLGGAGATLQTRRAGAPGTPGRAARTGTAVVALAAHPAGTELCVAGADRTVALYDCPALDREGTLCTARARRAGRVQPHRQLRRRRGRRGHRRARRHNSGHPAHALPLPPQRPCK